MFIAPFFSSFEVLNYVFGYKAKEIKKYTRIIEADIAHYRLQKGLPMRKGVNIDLGQKED